MMGSFGVISYPIDKSKSKSYKEKIFSFPLAKEVGGLISITVWSFNFGFYIKLG